MWFVVEVNIRALMATLAAQMLSGGMDAVHYLVLSVVATMPIAAPVGTPVLARIVRNLLRVVWRTGYHF